MAKLIKSNLFELANRKRESIFEYLSVHSDQTVHLNIQSLKSHSHSFRNSVLTQCCFVIEDTARALNFEISHLVVCQDLLRSYSSHYANMSVQYSAIFHGCKNDNFQMKFFDSFLIFAQNIDCGYTLEPPQRGGSNEYPQSMFWSKNKKNMYTRVNPTFSI